MQTRTKKRHNTSETSIANDKPVMATSTISNVIADKRIPEIISYCSGYSL